MKQWMAVLGIAMMCAVSLPAAQDDMILDVPFISQTEALCGGAAAAMVLRYWGARGIYAEDFASIVEDSAGGIRTTRLVADIAARGYRALPFKGHAALVQGHLSAGRPIIALVEDRPQRYHYVVLVAWRKGTVLLHDPATGPFRVVSDRTFDAAWAGAGRWGLLILPGDGDALSPSGEVDDEMADVSADSASLSPGAFASLVAEGVRFGRADDLDAAEVRLRAATVFWPNSALAWRELAGIRFRQQEWADAADFAQRAARLDSGDAHTWRLLGASRFIDGRPDGALSAWNRVGEPRLDLVQIYGLRRTRFAVASERLNLAPGSILTARAFRKARRRLSDFPVFESSRLDYIPLTGGLVEVEAAVQERPLFLHGPLDAVALGVRALTERELAISLSSPTGSGGLWQAAWRWEANRPSVRVAVSGPGVAGLPGILSIEGFREQQMYAVDLIATSTTTRRAIPQGTDSTSVGTVREVRRRAGVAWREWLGADLLCEADVGFEHWEAQNRRFFVAGLAMDLRRFRDALSVRIQTARWVGLGGGEPFVFGTVDVLYRPEVTVVPHARAEARVGYRIAGKNAPPALWLGAGTGRGRADLLRAHPLLKDGIVSGPVFGRSLWSAGLEFDYRPLRLGLLRAGVACFADMARSGRAARSIAPMQVDAGVGIRIAGFSPDGELALDVARGLRDGAMALSLVWRVYRR